MMSERHGRPTCDMTCLCYYDTIRSDLELVTETDRERGKKGSWELGIPVIEYFKVGGMTSHAGTKNAPVVSRCFSFWAYPEVTIVLVLTVRRGGMNLCGCTTGDPI
jgi:hypothetical protein